MNGDMNVAPAFAARSAWLALKHNVHIGLDAVIGKPAASFEAFHRQRQLHGGHYQRASPATGLLLP